MTEAQKEDLFIEWDLYEPHNQLAIIDEYRSANKGAYCKKSFLGFFKRQTSD